MLTFFEAKDMRTPHAETFTQLADYESTLVTSAPPAQTQEENVKLLCMYITSYGIVAFNPVGLVHFSQQAAMISVSLENTQVFGLVHWYQPINPS